MARRTNWSSCKQTGKRRFRTEEDAEAALRDCLKKQDNRYHGGARQEKRYYYCTHCNGFHLTSKKFNRTYLADAMEELRLQTLEALNLE